MLFVTFFSLWPIFPLGIDTDQLYFLKIAAGGFNCRGHHCSAGSNADTLRPADQDRFHLVLGIYLHPPFGDDHVWHFCWSVSDKHSWCRLRFARCLHLLHVPDHRHSNDDGRQTPIFHFSRRVCLFSCSRKWNPLNPSIILSSTQVHFCGAKFVSGRHQHLSLYSANRWQVIGYLSNWVLYHLPTYYLLNYIGKLLIHDIVIVVMSRMCHFLSYGTEENRFCESIRICKWTKRKRNLKI